MQALWMALGALFFSLMGVCIKIASPDYGPMEILFYRGLTGMVIFSAVMALQRVPLATPVPGLHVRRNISGVTAMALWFYGIAHLPFATAMMLNNMSSLWIGAIVMGFGWWRTRRFLYPKLFFAVVMGFVGVVLLLNPRDIGQNGLVPGLLGLLSGLLSAIAYTQVQSLGEAGEPEQRIVFYVSIGTAIMGLAGTLLWEGGFTVPDRHSLWKTFWLLPTAGFFAALGQWCLTRAYSRGAALVVASLQYLGLVFSSLFGVFLFHERLAWAGWLGMAIIIAAGIAATAWRPKTMAPPPVEETAPCPTPP
ncbi:MAG: DMT family transporter [Brachymonas sp.]|nr:DMT family transporter [Brachymonas sp.]